MYLSLIIKKKLINYKVYNNLLHLNSNFFMKILYHSLKIKQIKKNINFFFEY